MSGGTRSWPGPRATSPPAPSHCSMHSAVRRALSCCALLIIGQLLARRRWAVLFAVLVYIVPMLFAQLFKNVVDRPRPENPLVMVDHGSFPSGHVTLTAALMVMFIALLSPAVRRYWWPVAMAFVLVMIWSRTFLAAHWLSDTVAGAVLGAGVALTLRRLCTLLLARDDARRNAAQTWDDRPDGRTLQRKGANPHDRSHGN